MLASLSWIIGSPAGGTCTMPGSGRRSAFQPFRRARWAPRQAITGPVAVQRNFPRLAPEARRIGGKQRIFAGGDGADLRIALRVAWEKALRATSGGSMPIPRPALARSCHRPHASTSPRCARRPSSPPKPPRRRVLRAQHLRDINARPRRDSRAPRRESAVPAAGLYVPRSPTTPVALRRQALPGSRRR